MDIDRQPCALLLVVAGAGVTALAGIVYDPQNPIVALLPSQSGAS